MHFMKRQAEVRFIRGIFLVPSQSLKIIFLSWVTTGKTAWTADSGGSLIKTKLKGGRLLFTGHGTV